MVALRDNLAAPLPVHRGKDRAATKNIEMISSSFRNFFFRSLAT